MTLKHVMNRRKSIAKARPHFEINVFFSNNTQVNKLPFTKIT